MVKSAEHKCMLWAHQWLQILTQIFSCFRQRFPDFFCMPRFCSLFLCKFYNLQVPKLRYSAVRRLLDLDKMADNNTCKVDENSLSGPEKSEDNFSLKRPLNDDIKIEDTSNKRLKTELCDEKVLLNHNLEGYFDVPYDLVVVVRLNVVPLRCINLH